MSASPIEAPSLSKLISCLLLNLGTITEPVLEAQKIAGKAANEGRKPVVFDPVGVGATSYRKKSAGGTCGLVCGGRRFHYSRRCKAPQLTILQYLRPADLLNACHVSIIKGNAGEIGALAGLSEVQSRGVDSVGKGFKDPATVVRTLAARESASPQFSLSRLPSFFSLSSRPVFPSPALPALSICSPRSERVLTAGSTPSLQRSSSPCRARSTMSRTGRER